MTKTTDSPVACVACGDTGRNSKGGICAPCRNKGRQPLRDAVLGAVTDLFASYWARGDIPTEDRILEAVRLACVPPVSYVAGFRDSNGDMAILSGPLPDIAPLLTYTPPEDPYRRKAYIVRSTRTGRTTDPIIEPVARWKDGRWQRKKHT